VPARAGQRRPVEDAADDLGLVEAGAVAHVAVDVVQRGAAAELHRPDAPLRLVAAERAVGPQVDAVRGGGLAQAQEGAHGVRVRRETRGGAGVDLDDVRSGAAGDLEFVEHEADSDGRATPFQQADSPPRRGRHLDLSAPADARDPVAPETAFARVRPARARVCAIVPPTRVAARGEAEILGVAVTRRIEESAGTLPFRPEKSP